MRKTSVAAFCLLFVLPCAAQAVPLILATSSIYSGRTEPAGLVEGPSDSKEKKGQGGDVNHEVIQEHSLRNWAQSRSASCIEIYTTTLL